MSSAQTTFESFRPETAWQAYYPNGANPWNEVKVAHLYRRAAFGASWAEIAQGLRSTPDKLVTRLMSAGEGLEEFEADAARLEAGVIGSGNAGQLKALWMYRLLYSPHPLRERMVLFWHNHFATSNAKVKDVRLMHRQHEIFRRGALGHFGEMLQAITRDPAMLIWLDANTNRKGQPNENYARELFELFSLGVGHYSETDVKEAARALTGWDVRDGEAVVHPSRHDPGRKTILGQTGAWGAGDVVRIALSQPACARFLVRKLFRELVSETVQPSDEMLEPLADEFRVRNYDVGWLVERMLRSWVFFSSAAIGQKVKGPIELVAGTIRTLEGRAAPRALADVCDRLGQSLFYPPSVKGWDGGKAWLNSNTLLGRQNLAFDLTKGTQLGLRCDPARLAGEYAIHGDEPLVQFFLQLFHQNPDHASRSEMVAYLVRQRRRLLARRMPPRVIQRALARTAAHLSLTLPEYQLG